MKTITFLGILITLILAGPVRAETEKTVVGDSTFDLERSISMGGEAVSAMKALTHMKTPVAPAAQAETSGAEHAKPCFSKDCAGIVSGDAEQCYSKDCAGIVSGDAKRCYSKDCAAFVSGDAKQCYSKDCAGIVSGDANQCYSKDCAGIVSGDAKQCYSKDCAAFVSGDANQCYSKDCAVMVAAHVAPKKWFMWKSVN